MVKVEVINMKTVHPITNKFLIDRIKNYLKSKNTRDYILFLLGINTGLRISDLLNLKVCDIKNIIYIKEKKTGKENFILLNKSVKRELNKYIITKKYNDYLFTARYTNRKLSRIRAYKILKEVGEVFNINHLGCHSLRKTFGYNFYKKYKDIAALMDILNHSQEIVTMRYIGITQEIKDNYMKNFSL